MKIIENAWSRWSVWAGVFFTAVWGSVSAAWVLIDPQTQQDILSDFGLGQTSPNKLMAYLSLLAALSAGVTLGLRLIRQQGDPPAA